jgi:hypothetical protein
MSAKFRPVPEAHKKLLSTVTSAFPKLEERKLFGCPVWFLNGNMVVGAHQEDIFIRLSEEDREVEIEDGGAMSFSPMPGRTMKEYVVLPESTYISPEDFAGLLHKSIEYVSSLPPKKSKESSSR